MYFSRRRPLEDFPNEMTEIWSCINENCKGWIRDRFSFEDVPICSHCKSQMVSSVKNLPILLDSSYNIKNYEKKQNSPT